MGHLPQADPTETELAVVATGAAAKLAAITMLDLEFRCLQRLQKLRFR